MRSFTPKQTRSAPIGFKGRSGFVARSGSVPRTGCTTLAATLALLAVPSVASAIDVFPGNDTISAALATLTGPGPHTITLKTSTNPNIKNHFVESAPLVITGKNVTIVGLGAAGIWYNSTPFVEAVRVGAGGTLTLLDVTMDGSVPPADLSDPVVLGICDFGGLGHPGITVDPGGTLNIENGIYRCFIGANGGAVSSNAGNIDIYGAKFEINLADDGGHISADASTSFTVSNSTFEYGAAIVGSGGAILAVGGGDVTIVDNEFHANEAISSGGAVYTVADSAEIWGNTFEGNVAFTLVTYLVEGDADDVINDTGLGDDVLFSILTYAGEGGALYADAADVDLWNNLFCGNLGDQGGAVSLPGPGLSTLENNVFADNLGVHYGGAVHIDGLGIGVDPYIVNNTFIGNEAGRNPPSLPPLVHAIGAGGHLTLDGTLADLRNNIFSNAPFGAAVLGKADEMKNWDLGAPVEFEYNIWYGNCDSEACSPADPAAWQEFSGDLDTHALTPTNLFVDPLPVYFGSEGNCFPDAFYTDWDSPAVDRGDPTLLDPYDLPNRASDIGAYGGPRADVEDDDADGYADIYDCNDFDLTVNPEAAEICDGEDNNCNGEVDEGFVNGWWKDTDGDGYGNFGAFGGIADIVGCTQPAGYVDNNEDCDDNNAAVSPIAAEVCDLVDNDCDEVVDEDSPIVLYYPDTDDDDYGVDGSGTVQTCFPSAEEYFEAIGEPTNIPYVNTVGDCNDTDPTIKPGAEEICDGKDNDCDPSTLEDDLGGTAWYDDADGDGYGTDDSLDMRCEQPEGAVALGGDCDDTRADVSPVAVELCNEIDDDCDTLVDDDPIDGTVWYPDNDGDGVGDQGAAITTCDDEPPTGYFDEASLTGTDDCDDADPENLSEACAAACGCKATPTPSSAGLLVLLVLGMVRRRRA